FGFLCSVLSVLFSFGYLCYKLLFWDRFSVGVAPVAIGLFFFSSVQLIFIGLVGEYVGSIHTHVVKRPLVVERERRSEERVRDIGATLTRDKEGAGVSSL